MTEIKICNKCLIEKQLDRFSINGKYIKNICKDCVNGYSKERYVDNIDIISNQHREYYNSNKDNILLNQKTWYIKNKGSALLKKMIRKRRIENVNDGTVTHSAIMEKLELQNYKCAYCNSDISNSEKHLDHIHPISKGGSHSIDNVHWACANCNLRKGAKLHEEFLTIINNER